MKYRAGLIGAGYISEFHVAALRRANVEIVGICDLDAARADSVANRLGIRRYSSADDLAAAGANVLHVLTPPHTHAALTLEALDLGCHVLVEKPLAVDPADCVRIEQRAKQTGLSVCVNHSLLFDPQVRRALEVVRSGKLGRIVSVDILRSSAYPSFTAGALPPQYRTAGYPFRDLGVHALYLFEALLGPIEDVHADWKSLGGDPNLAFDEWRAQVRCREGLGQFQLSWNVRPLQSQIIIQGTRGVMRVDLFLMFKALRRVMPLPKAAERIANALTDSVRPLVEVPRGVWGFARGKVLPYHGLQDLVKEFYRALSAGDPVPVEVSDATRVVRWTEQVAQAADAEHAARVRSITVSDEVPVLVTGASGALGSEVVARLRARGTRVRAMMRRLPNDLPVGVEVAIGDLGDPEAVDRAVRGARVVIHVGAAMKGAAPEHDRATIAGTKHVLDACVTHRVSKLVHISSMAVVDWAGGPIDSPIDESSPLEPRPLERGHYTQAKLEAENLVRGYVKDAGVRAIILRPGQIFGGRIPLITGAVARRLGGRWLVLGNGELRLPLVYIDDVVDAILVAADCEFAAGQIVQLVDPTPVTQNDVLSRIHGESARVVRVPRAIVFSLGKLSEWPFGLLRRTSPIARYRLRSALARRTFRTLCADSILQWRPRVGVVEGMCRVADELNLRDQPTASSAVMRPSARRPSLAVSLTAVP